MAETSLNANRQAIVDISYKIQSLAADLAGVTDVLQAVVGGHIEGDAQVINTVSMLAQMVEYTNHALCTEADKLYHVGE